MRRHAAARGWSVLAVPEADSRPDRIPALLKEKRPIGCIVECSDGRADLPPRLFRGVPVVYLNAARNLYGGRIARVVADNEAIAHAAFRELSAGRPAAYAFVGFRQPRAWSRVRGRTFRALALETGRPFLLFRYREAISTDFVPRLAAWLPTLPRHTAVFATNNATAIEVAHAAEAAGLRIPRDLTILGVDNQEDVCMASVPTLSYGSSSATDSVVPCETGASGRPSYRVLSNSMGILLNKSYFCCL